MTSFDPSLDSLEVLSRDLLREEQQLRDTTMRERRRTLDPLTMTLVVVAAVKVVGALAILFTSGTNHSPASSAIPIAFIILHLLAFGGMGMALVLAHARDSRTAHLGVVLLLIASAFATTHFRMFTERLPPFALLADLYPDAFIAYYFARFVRDFPRRLPHSFPDRVLRVLLPISGVLGWTLFLANACARWLYPSPVWSYVEVLVRRSAGGTFYWTSIFALVLLLFPVSITGLKYLPSPERRRIRWFWSAFAIGFGPVVLAVVLGGVPRYGQDITRSILSTPIASGLQVLLATVPLCVAYALLVSKILPVRVVLRVAIQHVLARWTVTGAILIPLLVVATHLYAHRDETVSSALSGHYTLLLIVPVASAVALCVREDLLRLIDRHFFREVYDAAQLLITLSAESRRIQRLDELVAVLTAGIERALRPERIAVLLRDPANLAFASIFGAVEPLKCRSILGEVLAVATDPLDVNLDASGAFRWLPKEERQWLVDSGSRLLVPLFSTQKDVLGFVTLGERKGRLPFSREDRRLLQTIADSAALTIETHSTRSAASGTDGDGRWQVGMITLLDADECPGCGRVAAAGAKRCGLCGSVVRPAEVPHVMFGKFRFERRVGQGAMGIVYQAMDLALDRTVAIKTLPGTSPEHSRRLYLEAKAMAAVTHRNLAVIHGAETWRGRPMLIVEFMARGTLTARLAEGPLPPGEAVSLGIALSEALHVIHNGGLLHRDIKPSNIGYTDRGVPKLLDFGLAHMLSQPSDQDGKADLVSPDEFATRPSLATGPAGTPLYLSPEASRGLPPDASFDLWSLNVLLFEAITGHHPFRGRTLEETYRLIRQADIRAALPMIKRPALASYFERALGRDRVGRPRTAAEMVSWLREVS